MKVPEKFTLADDIRKAQQVLHEVRDLDLSEPFNVGRLQGSVALALTYLNIALWAMEREGVEPVYENGLF